MNAAPEPPKPKPTATPGASTAPADADLFDARTVEADDDDGSEDEWLEQMTHGLAYGVEEAAPQRAQPPPTPPSRAPSPAPPSRTASPARPPSRPRTPTFVVPTARHPSPLSQADLSRRAWYRRVVHPSCRFRRFWDNATALLSLYVVLRLPLYQVVDWWPAPAALLTRLGLVGEAAGDLTTVGGVLAAMVGYLNLEPVLAQMATIQAAVTETWFFLDVLLNLRTGYINMSGELIVDEWKIAKRYISRWLLLDLLGLFPFEWVMATNNVDLHYDCADNTLDSELFFCPPRNGLGSKVARIFQVVRRLQVPRLIRTARGHRQLKQSIKAVPSVVKAIRMARRFKYFRLVRLLPAQRAIRAFFDSLKMRWFGLKLSSQSLVTPVKQPDGRRLKTRGRSLSDQRLLEHRRGGRGIDVDHDLEYLEFRGGGSGSDSGSDMEMRDSGISVTSLDGRRKAITPHRALADLAADFECAPPPPYALRKVRSDPLGGEPGGRPRSYSFGDWEGEADARAELEPAADAAAASAAAAAAAAAPPRPPSPAAPPRTSKKRPRRPEANPRTLALAGAGAAVLAAWALANSAALGRLSAISKNVDVSTTFHQPAPRGAPHGPLEKHQADEAARLEKEAAAAGPHGVEAAEGSGRGGGGADRDGDGAPDDDIFLLHVPGAM